MKIDKSANERLIGNNDLIEVFASEGFLIFR